MSAEMDEVMVLDELDGSGMHMVHVMRQGKPVERGRWIEAVPLPGLDSLACRVDVEQLLNVHHLWVYWMARELIRCKEMDGVGALWWMDRLTVRETLVRAAEWFWGETGLDGNVGLVQRAPKAAPRDAQGKLLPVRLSILGEERELELREASWVPRDFVVVTREENKSETAKNQ